MLLPFANSWNVRCAKCSHRGVIVAPTYELAARSLRCGKCGHRQPFTAGAIAPAKRRKASRRRWSAATVKPTATPTDPMLNDRVADLWMAG